MANKSGWWIQVDTTKTQAAEIVFMMGTSERDRRFSSVWHSADPTEFDVPANLVNVKKLWLMAVSCPEDKNSFFKLFYQGNERRTWNFDDFERTEVNQ